MPIIIVSNNLLLRNEYQISMIIYLNCRFYLKLFKLININVRTVHKY